jgi:hypothetical protein
MKARIFSACLSATVMSFFWAYNVKRLQVRLQYYTLTWAQSAISEFNPQLVLVLLASSSGTHARRQLAQHKPKSNPNGTA